MSPTSLSSHGRIPLWRDVRVLKITAQIAFVIVIVLFAAFLRANLQANLASRGMTLSYSFLESTAGFDIGESHIPYQLSDTYGRAILVGLVNTLVLVAWGIVLTTIVGVIAGIARLSSNWLIRQLAAVYINVIRNTPLLIQLMFWYFGIVLQLPVVRQAIVLPGPMYLSQRGLYLTWPAPTAIFTNWTPFLVAAIVSPLIGRFAIKRIQARTDRPAPLWSKFAVYVIMPVSIALIGAALLPAPPLALDRPELKGLNFKGGLRLTPEFAALLFGVVVYTGAFIAEIVRAGIQAVSRGQVEAARALALTSGQTLRLVVFPQALRVIIPPLTSQYLNLAKNSSLAIAIGFPDLFSVAGTVFNQTGTAIEIVFLLMVSYLSMSLFTSLVLNIYNTRVRLVER